MDHIASVSSEGTEVCQPDFTETSQAPSTESNPPEAIPEHDQLEGGESWEWEQFLLEGHEGLRSHDIVNHERTRLYVLSGTDTENISSGDEELWTVLTKGKLKSHSSLEKDNQKIRLLKMSQKTNKMQFHLFDLGEHFSNSENMTGKEFDAAKSGVLAAIMSDDTKINNNHQIG